MQIRIYYEDADPAGIVYHANYLKYCERARSEIFFAKSIMPFTDKGHFLLKTALCEFVAPAKIGDLISVNSQIQSLKNASFTVKQTITKNNQTIFIGTFSMVFVVLNKPCKIPTHLKTFLQELSKNKA